MKDWRAFFFQHQKQLEENYPGLTCERFLKEAHEIGDEGESFLRGVPFAYLLGYAEFAHDRFRVNSSVLVPRPETEQLFELALQELKNQPQWKRVLDVGTGSGCLGLSIARAHPAISCSLVDISPEALKLARFNAQALGLTNVEFGRSDLLSQVTGLFDLIVSNPPYIPSDSTQVHPRTHQFEPHLALYVPTNEYASFFQKFFSQVARHLTADGIFLMEGHEYHMTHYLEWAHEAKLQEPQILLDLAGKPRFLRAAAARSPL